MKCYDHSNFSRASVVQFRASRWFISPNRTAVWKFLTIRFSRELPLFNFERLDILCPLIGHPCEKLWTLEFLESFRCSIWSVRMSYVPESDICVKSYDHSNLSRASVFQFRASRWVMSTNQTSVWNVMTIQISWELTPFNFERLDILFPRIGHPCKKLWQFEFVDSFCCSISSVSIYYVPNRTSEWNIMTIRISRLFSLFNFEPQKWNYHWMTPIEHFLIYIMQISFRDWIEKRNSQHRSWNSPDRFFFKTLAGQWWFFLWQWKFSCFGVA